MPFEPGNQAAKGRKKPREFADMLRLAVKEAYGDSIALRGLADALVKKALEGDVPALKEVADRLDGKVPQGVIGGDDDDNPINLVAELRRTIVRPNP